MARARTILRTAKNDGGESLVEIESTLNVPLFPNYQGDADGPGRIAIARTAPNDGYLSDAPELTITESWLRDNFGGGQFELTLYSKGGDVIGTPRRIKIAGPPLPRGELESRARDVVKDAADQSANTIDLQARMFRDQLALMRAEADAQRERAKMELELSIKRAQFEADERENRERQRFEREIQRERERAQNDRERDREAQATAVATQSSFMLAVQAMSKEQNTLLMGLLTSQRKEADPLETALRIQELVAKQTEMVSPDPAQEQTKQLWGVVDKGLTLAMATERRQQAPAQQVQAQPVARKPAAPIASKPVANPTARPSTEKPDASEVKTRLASIFSKLMESGTDPAAVLKGLDDGTLVLVPREDYEDGQDALDELDGRGTDDERDEPNAVGMEDGERAEQRPANEAAVGDDQAQHGHSTATPVAGEPNGHEGTAAP